MYEPVRNLLTTQGFIVRGEVKGCDIAAIQGETLWIVEMKLSANITLIYQAMERQTATNHVFIAIPRPRKATDANFRALQKLLKKLDLGLITVALDSPVKHAEIIIFPAATRVKKETKKSAAIKKEILGRTTDTIGGTSKTAINTAYRERCVKIACLLEAKGPLSAKILVQQGCEKDAYSILRSNYSGWFAKVSKGIYGLTDAGCNYLNENSATPLVAYYRMKALDIV
ncbi:MAG: DUF2161 family putative PD-(D/E)XK-type phosphodiesterase [Defluviitaleaceae bacterium]|nr:DUF2161 family putative PD-(D/E)XK-type phosphodiesterase [Defluviitaleaceae bacterium]